MGRRLERTPAKVSCRLDDRRQSPVVVGYLVSAIRHPHRRPRLHPGQQLFGRRCGIPVLKDAMRDSSRAWLIDALSTELRQLGKQPSTYPAAVPEIAFLIILEPARASFSN